MYIWLRDRRVCCNECWTELLVEASLPITMIWNVLAENAQYKLFRHSCQEGHCLSHLYTDKPRPPGTMQLRTRGHKFQLSTIKYEFNKCNFIVRSLFNYLWLCNYIIEQCCYFVKLFLVHDIVTQYTCIIIYTCAVSLSGRTLVCGLSCARPVADGWQLMWVNCPL